jgi:histone-lysine N-methyltransferase SETMAR
VTLDEAWLYFSNQHEQLWLPEDEDPPINARPTIESPKTMLTVVWNPHGFHVIKVLPRGCKWTSQYYIDNIRPEICALHIAGDRNKLVIHVDNVRPYVSTRIKQNMEEQGLRTAPHPSYSPDLAPSDFLLFGYVKRTVQGSECQTVEKLLAAVVGILNAIPTETLMSTFHEWIRRSQTCIDTDGESVESGLF